MSGRPGRLLRQGLPVVLMLLAGCRSGPPSGPPGGPPGQGSSGQPERASRAQTEGGGQEGYGNGGQERPGRRRSGRARAAGERSEREQPGRGRAETQGAAGQFDFYLLNLSWSPEFCATHGTSPECGRGLGFVVHGLWPQDNSGDYPEDCSDAPGPGNPWADTDIYPTTSLVQHEWTTHGTCSGLSADGYFTAVHKAFAEVMLPDVQAGTMTPDALLGVLQRENPSFPVGSFAVSCGNNRLTAVEVCLDKSLKPEACQNVRSCRANVVQVTGR